MTTNALLLFALGWALVGAHTHATAARWARRTRRRLATRRTAILRHGQPVPRR